jgi:hypothetical protein
MKRQIGLRELLGFLFASLIAVPVGQASDIVLKGKSAEANFDLWVVVEDIEASLNTEVTEAEHSPGSACFYSGSGYEGSWYCNEDTYYTATTSLLFKGRYVISRKGLVLKEGAFSSQREISGVTEKGAKYLNGGVVISLPEIKDYVDSYTIEIAWVGYKNGTPTLLVRPATTLRALARHPVGNYPYYPSFFVTISRQN